MLSQLLHFIAQFWRQLLPWYVMNAEQVGFVRRLGVPHRPAEPGLHWKRPLVEELEAEDAREYSVVLDPQSLRTKDGVDMVVRAAVTCCVVDAQRYFLNVCDGRTNIQDLVAGELGWLVQRRRSADVLGGVFASELTRRAARNARKWGIHIETVKLIDAVAAASYRVWQNQITSAGQE